MKSFLGWLLLLVALAVPAVFFFNWWTKMEAAKTESSTPQIKKKAFGPVRSTQTGGLSNPIKKPGETEAVKDMTPPTAVVSSSGSASSQGEMSPQADSTDNARGPMTASEARLAASSPPAGGPAASGVSRKKMRKPQVLEYNPQTNRDPTLSVLDIKILALREEARRQALMPKPKPNPKPAPAPVAKPLPPPVWKQITVQGIISTPNGRAAIVNDELRYLGDEVLGAVIKKITSSNVIFRYKGKTFYKRVD